jgi:hypothetical protein
LTRGSALPAQKLSALSAAIDKAESRKDVAPLKTLAASLEKDAAAAKTPADAERMRALSEILTAQH